MYFSTELFWRLSHTHKLIRGEAERERGKRGREEGHFSFLLFFIVSCGSNVTFLQICCKDAHKEKEKKEKHHKRQITFICIIAAS